MSKEVQHFSSSEGFVCMSSPGTKEYSLSSISDVDIKDNNSVLDQYDFIIAPFNKQKNETYLLKFENQWENAAFEFDLEDSDQIKETLKSEYISSFNEVEKLIKEGIVEKLVLSKTKLIAFPNNKYCELYKELVSKYKNAFVYCFYIPEIGFWMGATPEVLLNKTGSDYHTVALAGTKKINGPLKEVKWGDKEIRELRIIEEYVEDYLKANSIEFKISETYTSEAGAMCHIKSDIFISGELDVDFLINIIHPGPAISGRPKDLAIEHIGRIENHSREYYAGYLGPIQRNGNFDFFVNLRCMKLKKGHGVLYLGGGIIESSNVEDEWNETELKATTIMRVIDAKAKEQDDLI